MSTPITGVRYSFDLAGSRWFAPGRTSFPAILTPSSDWSESNPPWAYSNTSVFTSRMPAGTTVVDIQTGSGDFWTNLSNTVNAAPGRVVVRLQEGVYHLDQFRVIGSGNDPTYAFGFWFPKLQGFLGDGPDSTFIQMDANSVSTAQLNWMAGMTQASFAPLQMGLCRIDGTTASPVFLAGLTFRAADQQNLTSKASDLPVFVPQPAPHLGVVIYSGSPSVMSYVRFQGAGRAINSQPPFECGNVGTQYSTHRWDHCEFDGRRSPALDAARPRRCGVFLINNETKHELEDCWFHHSNVSRYAANDQNRNTQGEYIVDRVKAEHITNNANSDPAINGGASLGGVTNATPFGWESSNATIRVRNTIISQNNSNPTSGTGQIPMHFQMTTVGSRNPQGGRFYADDNTYLWPAHPHLNGYAGFRISQSTYWWSDGFNNTLFVTQNGTRLSPHVVTGTWPPTAASLAAASVTPATHFLIRST